MDITPADITAAKENDLAAVSKISEATSDMVARIASSVARNTSAEADDLAQVGRIAVWEGLKRFAGSTVDEFTGFAYRTAKSAMLGELTGETLRGGISADSAKVFGAMLRVSNGDKEVARELAQTLPPKGKRLSKEAAWAAYGAFNTVSLDFRRHHDDDDDDYFDVADLTELPADLIEPRDIDRARRIQTQETVRAVLNTMPDSFNETLRHTYGIERPTYATDRGSNEELAKLLGTTRTMLIQWRTRGLKSFAKRYVKATARDTADVERMMAAANNHLSR